jgi:hypothetical protein
MNTFVIKKCTSRHSSYELRRPPDEAQPLKEKLLGENATTGAIEAGGAVLV